MSMCMGGNEHKSGTDGSFDGRRDVGGHSVDGALDGEVGQHSQGRQFEDPGYDRVGHSQAVEGVQQSV